MSIGPWPMSVFPFQAPTSVFIRSNSGEPSLALPSSSARPHTAPPSSTATHQQAILFIISCPFISWLFSNLIYTTNGLAIQGHPDAFFSLRGPVFRNGARAVLWHVGIGIEAMLNDESSGR